jgi:osmotically-inducible protein OsmY
MKISSKAIPAIILAGLMTGGVAQAYSVSDIDDGVNAASVFLNVDDGVVTLTGTIDSTGEKARIESAAESLEGVTEVHNFLSVSE